MTSLAAALLFFASSPSLSATRHHRLEDQEQLGRLALIATELQSPSANSAALLKEAVQLCGFRVRTEVGAQLAVPPQGVDLYLDVTDSEIRDYSRLFKFGQGTRLVNLTEGVDSVLKNIGYSGSCKDDVYHWLRDGIFSEKPATRALTSFIRALGSHHKNPADLTISDGTTLDAIQNLLILRVLTEEIEMPLRRRIPRKSALLSSAAFYCNAVDWSTAPGYGQDQFIAGETGLATKVLTWLSGEGESSLAGKITKINPILTLIKVIASYAMLKGEITVEAPGAPLVRTKSSFPDTYGEQRTVVAHFYYDPNAATDIMKDYRPLFAVCGIDTDMPKGDLNGVETAWEFLTPLDLNHQTFRGVTGQGDPSRLVTDAEGKARYKIEGRPQFERIQDDLAFPIDRKYTLIVTPQLKKASAGADATDIGLGALSIAGGDVFVGSATILAEFMNRVKWSNKTKYELVVRDWTNAKVIGSLTIHLRTNGHDGADSVSSDQVIDVEDLIMLELSQPKKLPPISPEILKLLSPAEQQKVKEAMAIKLPDVPVGFIPDPKFSTMGIASINDRRHSFVMTETWASSGGGAKFGGTPNQPGITTANFMIAVDIAGKKAYVKAESMGDVTYTKHMAGTDESTSETVRSGFGRGLSYPITDPEKGIFVPVTIERSGSSTGPIRYISGHATVPYLDGTGTVEIRFVLQMRGK